MTKLTKKKIEKMAGEEIIHLVTVVQYDLDGVNPEKEFREAEKYCLEYILDVLTKALQSYSLEMDKVIGKDEETSYIGFDLSDREMVSIGNELRQSQRQKKLKVDKKWGIR